MRIGELSRRSGVPAATIKYYVREGLLPAGDRTKANQAEYEDGHLRRLGLVRALIEIGGLSVRAAQQVIAYLDEPDAQLLAGLGKAQYALTPLAGTVPDEAARQAEREGAELIARQGWMVGARSPARASLAEAVAVLHRLGRDDLVALLDGYAAAAAQVAAVDVAAVFDGRSLDEMAEAVVVWTVLGDRVFSALRRMAQESEAARRVRPAGDR